MVSGPPKSSFKKKKGYQPSVCLGAAFCTSPSVSFHITLHPQEHAVLWSTKGRLKRCHAAACTAQECGVALAQLQLRWGWEAEGLHSWRAPSRESLAEGSSSGQSIWPQLGATPGALALSLYCTAFCCIDRPGVWSQHGYRCYDIW